MGFRSILVRVLGSGESGEFTMFGQSCVESLGFEYQEIFKCSVRRVFFYYRFLGYFELYFFIFLQFGYSEGCGRVFVFLFRVGIDRGSMVVFKYQLFGVRFWVKFNVYSKEVDFTFRGSEVVVFSEVVVVSVDVSGVEFYCLQGSSFF